MQRRSAIVTLLLLGCAAPSIALETDQFLAWGKPLRDAAAPIDARFNAEIKAALERVNAGAPPRDCHELLPAVMHRFRRLILQRPEVWSVVGDAIDRYPIEPRQVRELGRHDIYRNVSKLEPLQWMPHSPTIEVNGVRFGTDKLGHFVSEGWLGWRRYQHARSRGMSAEQAEESAIDLGLLLEKTTLGYYSSGIFSTADAEANTGGLEFYRDLCDGKRPMLTLQDGHWTQVLPFRIAHYVSIEWDESWQPNIYLQRLWKRIRPAMQQYCEALRSPEVARQRARYSARDRVTVTEQRIGELVARGKLPDPEGYSIEAVCSDANALH